jgi:hypothetical protein
VPGLRLQVNLFGLDSISDSEHEQDESAEHLEAERSVLARRCLDVMRLTETRVLILR